MSGRPSILQKIEIMEDGVDKGMTLRKVKYVRAFLACCALSPVIAANAQAQDNSGVNDQAANVEDIVVTANKRSENSQRVPIAIHSVTAASLERSGISSTADLGAKVAGVTFQASFAGLQPHIRGVGTTAVSAANENSVATYLDGVYIAGMSASLLELSNIEQVDVLKGPQGTLFGRNATGGLVMVRTKDPTQDFHLDAKVSYGNYDTVSGSVYMSGGLAPGLAMDIAAYGIHQADGYGVNTFTGNEIGKNKAFAVRSKLVYSPSDSTTIRIAADISEAHPNYLVQTYNQPGYYVNIPGGTPYINTRKNPWDIENATDPQLKMTQKGLSLTVIHEMPFAELTSISAYRDSGKEVTYGIVPAPVTLQSLYFDEFGDQFTQELQLTSSGPDAFKWTAGAFYLHSSAGYNPFLITGPALAPLQSLNFVSDAKTDAGAVYGQATIALGEKTNITAGLRYSIEKKSITGYTEATFLPPLEFLSGRNGLTDASKTFRKLTWRLGADHQFSDTVFGYVSYDRGFKSGVYPTIPPGGPTAEPVEPEVLDSVAIGLKTDLADRKVRLNVGAFWYEYKNLQVNIIRGTSITLENGAKARIYGLEGQITARPTDRLTIEASAEVIHGRFRSYPNGSITTPLPASLGGGNVGSSGDLAGNRLPYAPDYTMSVSASYVVPLAEGSLTFSGNLYHTAKWFSGADNIVEQSAYSLLNGQVTWSLSDSGPEISIWGKNITNKAYSTFIGQGLNPGGYTNRSIAPPRTYGVTLRYSF